MNEDNTNAPGADVFWTGTIITSIAIGHLTSTVYGFLFFGIMCMVVGLLAVAARAN